MAFAHRDDQAEFRANVLKDAVEALAAELRLVDVGDFVAYIHCEQFANIQDIVNSSIELFFKPGTLSYGGGAQFELDWDKAPAIMLDLEFRHRAVRVIFKLTLHALQTRVTIEQFSVESSSGGADHSTRLLIESIADARSAVTGH